MPETESRDPRFAELDALIKAEGAAPARNSSRQTPRKPRKQLPRKRQFERRTARPAGQPEHATLAQGKEFARKLAEITRRIFEDQLNRAEFIQVAQVFRAGVVPSRKPGRHPHAQITEALEARKAAKPWAEIFQALIPGHAKMSKWRRRAVEKRLREGVRTRLRRERQRAEH